MSSEKWYDSPLVDEGVVISARVRFARNFEDYPFPIKLDNEQAKKLSRETADAVLKGMEGIYDPFKYFDITNNPDETLLPLMERHVLSKNMVEKKGTKGIIMNDGETRSIMLNEEDHIRIQSIFPGDNLDGAYESSVSLEACIEEHGINKYAYDIDYGFLTSCPTNVGTGMRASYMLHLPALEAMNYISRLLPALGKFGMAVRGIHGEGSESLGSVYQLSNQITLGKTEQEIIVSLKSAVSQVIAQETGVREQFTKERKVLIEDRLYRSYGILTSCRRIDHKEAMSLLSDIRVGFSHGVYGMPKPARTIYSLMTSIQPGSLNALAGKPMSAEERDVFRAEYLRKHLTGK